MGIVSAAELKQFMSEPRWTPSQEDTAEVLCVGVEESLEDALHATFITPRPWTETASVLTDSGLIDTTYPVHQVIRIDGGTELNELDPLPAGYLVQNHRLYYRAVDVGATLTPTPTPWFPFAYSPRFAPRYAGTVRVEYLAGWGPVQALRVAIMRKAQVLMANRHDDTMTVRGLDAAAPPKLGEETWTEAELRQLGRYRRLGAGGR